MSRIRRRAGDASASNTASIPRKGIGNSEVTCFTHCRQALKENRSEKRSPSERAGGRTISPINRHEHARSSSRYLHSIAACCRAITMRLHCVTFAFAVLGLAPADCPVTAEAPHASHRDALRVAAMNNGGNPAHGQKLFVSERYKCSVCHQARGQGGDSGPDLSQIGGKFDRTHLIESILEPSAQILEGYRTTIIDTVAGRVVAGIVRSESTSAITLVDAEGRIESIAKSQVESRTVSDVSPMPAGLADA